MFIICDYLDVYVMVVNKSIACKGVMIPSESLSITLNTFSTIYFGKKKEKFKYYTRKKFNNLITIYK